MTYMKFQLYSMRQNEGREKEPLAHKRPGTASCFWVHIQVSLCFEEVTSWLSGIPDLNLLESAVSRNWETAQICAAECAF